MMDVASPRLLPVERVICSMHGSMIHEMPTVLETA